MRQSTNASSPRRYPVIETYDIFKWSWDKKIEFQNIYTRKGNDGKKLTSPE